MVSPSYDKRYKTAIVLNNAAISLIERKRYKDAMDMFRVAISIIQASCCSLGEYDNVLPVPISVTDETINHHLKVATTCNVPTFVIETPPWERTMKFSTQQDPFDIRVSFTKGNENDTRTVFSYINIDPIDFEEISLDNIYHDSILILYNFGVAHCCLAQELQLQSNTRWNIAQELRQAAFQMFYVIETYVRKKLSDPPMLSQENAVLLLSALFSKTMSELASHLQYTMVSEYYSVAFAAILVSIDVHHKLLPMNDIPAAAA